MFDAVGAPLPGAAWQRCGTRYAANGIGSVWTSEVDVTLQEVVEVVEVDLDPSHQRCRPDPKAGPRLVPTRAVRART